MGNKRKLVYVNGDINMLFEVDNLNDGKLYKRQNGKCFFCGCEMKRHRAATNLSTKGYTRDHLFPQSKNNPTLNNKVLACFACNNKKGDRNPTQEEIEKYLKLYNGIAYSGGIKIPRLGSGGNPGDSLRAMGVG